MGRVRSAMVKRIAKMLVEKYGDKFTTDFEENKKLVEQFATVNSKRLRNQIAGYVTSLIKKLRG